MSGEQKLEEFLQTIDDWISCKGLPKIDQKEGIEAICLVAKTEGIMLDPIHTGKAMAGLIDLIHKGRFTSKDTVVFIHTGGIPNIFVLQPEFTSKNG